MACPVVNLRTGLLFYAQTGGTWTYNGYAATFDGDNDNLAQFVEVPASLPEEFDDPLAGDDPTVDPTGHTVGFYSLSYEVDDAGCIATNNIVLPIAATYYAGIDVIKSTCAEQNSIYNLFSLIEDFGNEANVDPLGSWQQINGTPNPHPGFYDGGTDPTTATFTTSTINYPSDTFPLQFYYTTQEPIVTGFSQTRCPQCSADHSWVKVTFYTVEGGCCPEQGTCYTVDVNDGENVHGFLLTVGSVTGSSFDPPYTLPGDNALLETELQNYLDHNGGGTVTVTADTGFSTIYIANPCVGFETVCLDGPCTSNVSISETTCV